MSPPGELWAAVGAGAIGAEGTHAALLSSIVDVARAIFAARASSIMLYDEEKRELEFTAVSGEGSGSMVGRRVPSGVGIAGWVATARQPIVLEDVGADPRFARDVAEATGYVPKGLMATPLLLGDRLIGVLSVLDRPQQAHFTLSEMELLSSFAVQAALALELVERARAAQRVLETGPGELVDLARLAEALYRLDGKRRDAGMALIAALRELVE